jgi:predicted metal-dependent hydrolase
LRKIEQFAQYQAKPEPDIDLDKAQTKLFHRLAHFSEKHNLPYNRATFRWQRTKWGSCSGRNNINLNVNLVFLPEELQDYVLLHELVHTKVRNHSKNFWTELDKYTQCQSRELSKKLKQHRMRLRV